jgi:hypothetical protein
MPDPFLERTIGAALEVRATHPEPVGRILTAPLTHAELRVLKLLPTASYVQITATLYISRNTVFFESASRDHPARVVPAASVRAQIRP